MNDGLKVQHFTSRPVIRQEPEVEHKDWTTELLCWSAAIATLVAIWLACYQG